MEKNKSWFVYMIEAENGHLYTGITTDPARRLREHRESHHKKGAKFFKTSRAKKLTYLEEVENRSMAAKREAAIKKLTRKEKLKLQKTSQ